jgi:hypothetical protein
VFLPTHYSLQVTNQAIVILCRVLLPLFRKRFSFAIKKIAKYNAVFTCYTLKNLFGSGTSRGVLQVNKSGG